MKLVCEHIILITILLLCTVGILTDPADSYWNQVGYKWEKLLKPINNDSND